MDFYGTQDFKQNQLLGAVVEIGTAFPVTPVIGQLFFRSDTTPKMLFIYLGAPPIPGTDSGWFNLNHAYYA